MTLLPKVIQKKKNEDYDMTLTARNSIIVELFSIIVFFLGMQVK